MSRGLPLAGLLAITAVTAITAGSRAQSEPPADEARGFDHSIHEGKVAVAVAEPPPCGACHQVNARGLLGPAPGHAACFGACHGPPPPRLSQRGSRERYRALLADPLARPVCETCHRPSVVGALLGNRRLRRADLTPRDPYGLEPDFAVSLSHKVHSAAAGGDCRACHATPGTRPARQPRGRTPGPHERCASCHTNGAAAGPMSDCTRCHTPAFGRVMGPRLVPGPLSVATSFDHAAHLARESTCVPCHAGAAETLGDDVPAPTKADCARCHDGSTAFSPVEARCRACHTISA